VWLTKTNLKSPWKVYIYMCLSDLCVFYEHKNDFQCAFCCLFLLPVNVFFFLMPDFTSVPSVVRGYWVPMSLH